MSDPMMNFGRNLYFKMERILGYENDQTVNLKKTLDKLELRCIEIIIKRASLYSINGYYESALSLVKVVEMLSPPIIYDNKPYLLIVQKRITTYMFRLGKKEEAVNHGTNVLNDMKKMLSPFIIGKFSIITNHIITSFF